MARASRVAPSRAEIAVGVVLAAAVIVAVLHHAGSSPGGDALVNLSVGRRFAAGLGPTLPDGSLMTFRAPVWPMVIGGGMAVLGDPLGAEVVRIGVVVAAVASVLLLTRRWYGRTAAVVALVTVVAAPPLVEVLPDWFADGLALALALLGLLVFDRALRRVTTRDAVAAGLLFALAVLVKESAGFVAIGPVVGALAVARRDGWAWIRPAALTAAVAMATVTPWLVLHLAVEDRFFLTDLGGWKAVVILAAWVVLLAAMTVAARGHGRRRTTLATRIRRRGVRGHTAEVAAACLGAVWVAVVASGLRGGLAFETGGPTIGAGAIVRHDLLPAFGVPLLFLVGLAFLVWHGSKGERTAIVHLAALAGYLPIFVLWPLNGSTFVARNALVGVVLVHIASARVLAGWAGAVRNASAGHRWRRASVLLPVAALLAVGVWVVSDALRMTPERDRLRAADLEAVSAWIDRSVPRGTPIMGSYGDWTWIARRTAGRYPVYLAPWTHLRRVDGRWRPRTILPVTGDPPTAVPAHFGSDWLAIRRSPSKGFIVGISETALLETLRSTGSRYLVLSEAPPRSTTAIARTLVRIPGIRWVARFGRTEVLAVTPGRLGRLSDPPVSLDASTRAYLAARRRTAVRHP